MQPDIQLRNGTIYDGSGGPGIRGCLDITDGYISGVGGPPKEAKKTVDCTGLVISPGFIDVHTHADLYGADRKRTESFLFQGVTSCVVGNCGFSAFPLAGEAGREHLQYAAGVMGSRTGFEGWRSFSDFSGDMEGRMSVNMAALVGHGALRASAAGTMQSVLPEDRLRNMCAVLDGLLTEGAAGLSLGLIYAPGSTARTEEFAALAEVVRRHGRILAVHLREEGRELQKSVQEMILLAERTGVHVHISHHKVMGPENWGQSADSLRLIRSAGERGLMLSLDAYPYDAACSTAMVLLPPWMMAEGTERALALLNSPKARRRMEEDLEKGIPGWENLSASCGWDRLEITSTASRDRETEGRSLSELGRMWNLTPPEALARVLLQEKGSAGIVIRGMWEQDVRNILTYPDTLIGSDGLFADGCLHPRRYGSFAKMFRHYVREQKVLTAESLISRMTHKAAVTFGLEKRGLLKEGYHADAAVFSQEHFCDRADFLHPGRNAAGMELVYVNGKAVLENGKPTGETPGNVLRVRGGAGS